jgi:uncharacterized protein
VKTALLDLNVLIALFWPTHEHHEPAHRWFSARQRAPWASCSLTQLGFVRLVTNPAFSRDALPPAHAVALLEENLRHPAHQFWTDRLQVPDALSGLGSGLGSGLTGYRQLTDAYLLAVARHHRGILATFDRGLAALAGDRGGLETIPTR